MRFGFQNVCAPKGNRTPSRFLAVEGFVSLLIPKG
jgi:hypothetical protein